MNFNKKEIIIWCLYGIFLFAIFLFYTDYDVAFSNALLTLLIQIIIYYLNLRYIIAKFYKGKHIYYLIINLGLIIFGLILSELGEELYELKFELNNFNEIHHKTLISHTIPCILSISASFFVFTLKKEQIEKEKKINLLHAEKNFLIQQINPHFLFNTLNNIYSLTLDNDQRGGQAILQLSKMLDYSIYSGIKEFVYINEEIDYINNFINLFMLKDDEIDSISLKYNKSVINKRIAPMLLIPFVENAFKHGDIDSNLKGTIYIELKAEDNLFTFVCINTFNKNKSIDKTSGIGVQNVSRRLELIYPSNHQIDIKQEDKLYSVILKINMNESI